MALHKHERKVSRKVFVFVYKEYEQRREYVRLLRVVLEILKHEGATEELMECVNQNLIDALGTGLATAPLVLYYQRRLAL